MFQAIGSERKSLILVFRQIDLLLGTIMSQMREPDKLLQGLKMVEDSLRLLPVTTLRHILAGARLKNARRYYFAGELASGDWELQILQRMLRLEQEAAAQEPQG